MDFEISDSALDLVRSKGGTAAIDFVDPIACGSVAQVSVDTHLEGKKTAGYRRQHIDDVTVLLAPGLVRHASKVQLVTKKRIIGSKLVALAHHQHSAACRQ